MKMRIVARITPIFFLGGLCGGSAVAGPPVLKQNEFERTDIPALSRALQFTPTDWNAKFTGSLVFYVSAESKGETSASVTVHGSSRTTFIADTVISETSLDQLEMAASDGFREELSEPSPLLSAKVAATLSGKIISSEVHASKVLKDFGNAESEGRVLAISKGEWEQYVKSQFGFLKNGLSPGREMGTWIQNTALTELLRPCGFAEKIPPLRAVGEYKGAIVGRLVWRPKPTVKCRADLDVTYAVDAVDGKPLRQIFRGKLDLIDESSKVTHFAVVGLFVPTFISIVNEGESIGEDSGPSFEKCRDVSKEIGHVAYPEASLDAREEGTAELRIKVGRQGGVDEVSLATSSGFRRLDEWAAAGAHAWKFDAAACGGLSLNVPVAFKAPN